MPTTSARSMRPLLFFVGAVALVAVVGGLAAGSAPETYRALELPPWAPPAWLFGPVWTALYLMIAVAGWQLWRARGWDVAVTLWVVQLGLNLAWTPLFFAGDRYLLALVDIMVLVLVIATLIALASSRSRTAMWLLLPYLAWVSFATMLNTAIVQLN